MKYKVGDTVTIRADLVVGKKLTYTVLGLMGEAAGNIVKIIAINGNGFKFDPEGYWFSFDMIQSKTNKLFPLL